MLTCETRSAALARLGRALADPTRCRILVALLDEPGYPAKLAEQLDLTRSNVSNHLSCLRGCGLGELVDVVLAVDTDVACVDDTVSTAAVTQ